MPKADPAAVKEYQRLLATTPGAVERPMFGQPAAFVGGNMFLGVFGDQVFVRLGEADRAAAGAAGATPFEPMAGRPMREYVVLPPKLLNDRKAAEGWAARSLKYALGLPPKKKGK